MTENSKTYLVRAEQRIEAAHNLRQYHGICERLHGHSWKMEVFVRAPKLDHEGLAIDYLLVKKALSEILHDWDHNYINNIPPFDKLNPSSENIATYIFEEMSKVVNSEQSWVEKVLVWEGPEYYIVCERDSGTSRFKST